MKRILSLFFVGLLLCSQSHAQDCDIAQNGLSVSPGTVSIYQGADFKFTIFNAGSDPNCTIPANTVRVVLALPINSSGRPAFYQFRSIQSPAGGIGTYFNFTYSSTDNAVVGVNKAAIPNLAEETDVTIRVTGIGATSNDGATTTLNIRQTGGVSNSTANDFSSAKLVVNSTILPLKLGAVTVTSKACQNTIGWSTLQEENTKSFTVESGKDGVNFRSIGTVAAVGNSTTRKNYSYTDAAPGEGITYYRLKMMNADNTFTYSNVVSIHTDCGTKTISVYPNPLLTWQQQLSVTVNGYKGQVKGELLSATGQLVEKYTLHNGTNSLTVGNLSLGSYVLRVIDGQTGEVTSQKIMVIR